MKVLFHTCYLRVCLIGQVRKEKFECFLLNDETYSCKMTKHIDRPVPYIGKSDISRYESRVHHNSSLLQ